MALSDNLVYLWELEEASGTRVDSMGNMDLSTVTGTPSSDTGIHGDAIVVDGTEVVSRSGVAALIAGAAIYNVSFWVYPTSIGTGQQAALNFSTAASVTTMSNRFSNVTGTFTHSLVDSNGTTRSVSRTAPTNDTWTHYFIRYVQNDSLYAYKNLDGPGTGTVGNFTYSANVTSPVTYIGGRSAAADRFIGRIDQVAIWTRDLTADERAAVYNSGSGTDLLAVAGGSSGSHLYKRRRR